MTATSANATETGTTRTPAMTIETFLQYMNDQDLRRLVGLYGPGAVWEVHVPGWDGETSDPEEILDLHQGYFGRLDFRVVAYNIIAQGDDVGLRWDLEWTDRDDGAPCASFQSHFFHVEGGQIRRHWMYCAGVRVYVE
jgi:ketosteroid isomerase-like protein